MKKLLLIPAILSVLTVPVSVTAQGRIKCVDTPLGAEDDPDPDTYCPTDYGTDPRNLGARDTRNHTALDTLAAQLDAKTEPERK